MKVFAPSTAYSSPAPSAACRRPARVRIACRSEPAPGSVIAIAPTISPRKCRPGG